MSIQTVYFDDCQKAVSTLVEMAPGKSEYVFRGQNCSGVKLKTSLNRFTAANDDKEIQGLLRRFEIALARTGIHPFERGGTRLDWLEYARHCGVPMPVLDFTYSPYIALFFAFDGLGAAVADTVERENHVLVYALNTRSLAYGWAAYVGRTFTEEDYRVFLKPKSSIFEEGFLPDILQILPFPGKRNRRMQKQMGLLLYDTLNYPRLGFDGLEDFIENIKEPEGNQPTLTKFYIEKSCAKKIFEKLELMNVTGSELFLDEQGAAKDVINSYHYDSKFHFRGLDNR